MESKIKMEISNNNIQGLLTSVLKTVLTPVLKTVLTVSLILLPMKLWAEDDSPKTACAAAVELFDEDDIEGALEEARWCVTLLEQNMQGTRAKFFADTIAGYEGTELEQNSAMGMEVITREYTMDDKYLTVTLTTGGTGNLAGAFAAFAQFGGQGGKKLRIQRRTAMDMSEGNSVDIIVTLKNGGVLKFESNDLDFDAVKSFAQEFPIADLDDSLR